MHSIELRLVAHASSPGDLVVTVQDQTFEFLQSSTQEEMRVSTYLDRDWAMVETRYEELYLTEFLSFRVVGVSAGSRTRKVKLPCEMHAGEQITLTIRRSFST
jgi:hypothetical protein